jgi:hypothetical protein
MPQRVLREQRLVGLFALGWLLLGYPLLALFNQGGTLGGIPVLYAYLFGVWAALIALMAAVVERGA